jgi:hypothetical protein
MMSKVPNSPKLPASVEDRTAPHADAAEFLGRRAAGHSLDDLDAILARVPARPPEPGDELPEGWGEDRLPPAER